MSTFHLLHTLPAVPSEVLFRTVPATLHRTLPAQIADWIAAGIIEEQFAPGERLNEKELALTLQVSRSPLREALRILEKRGLVTLTPQRGARVTSLSMREVRNLFEIRAVLVGLAGRQAGARMDNATLGVLAPCFERLEQTVQDAEPYARASAAATIAIAERSDNPHLGEMIVSFAHQIGRYARLGLASQTRRNRSIRHWRALHTAFRARDGERAEVLMKLLAFENRDAVLDALSQRETLGQPATAAERRSA